MEEIKRKRLSEIRLESDDILPLLIRMSLPMFAAHLFLLLYNIVDRMFAGRLPGEGTFALGGLGVSFPVIVFIAGFGALFGVGGASRSAVALGRGDINDAEKILGCSLALLICSGSVISVLFYFIRDPLLRFFGASGSILPYASSYLGIYLTGTLFILITSGLNYFIMCQGYSGISMATTCIGCILNIALDPLFMFKFEMGVKGAALATVISQAVSALWALLFFAGKKTHLKIRLKNLRIPLKTALFIVSLGISPFIMQVTESMIHFAFFNVIKKFGDDSYSALMSILLSLTNIVWLSLSGFSQGASPIIGYNYGGRNLERCKKTFKLLFIINLSLSVIVAGSMVVFPAFWISMFTGDRELIRLGKVPLRIFMLGGMLFGAQSSCQQTFLALGQSKISLFLAVLRKVILLFPLAFILPEMFGLGIWGLFWAESASDILAVCVTVAMFCLKGMPLFSDEQEQ